MPDFKELRLKPEEGEHLVNFRRSNLFHGAFNLSAKTLGLPDNVQQIIGQRNITFWEELVCAGYNPTLRQLEATVSVKQTDGYSGDLCSLGSPEFVRFFVDWGRGFEDVGLNSVQVHDIPDPAKGSNHPISYLVVLGLDDARHRRFCSAPVTPRLRAVLSWNTPPSTDPNALPQFGNRVDTTIQIAAAPILIRDIISLDAVKKLGTVVDQEQEAPLKLETAALNFAELVETHRRLDVPQHRTVFGALHPLIAPNALAFQPQLALKDIDFEKLNINLGAVFAALNKDNANTDFEQVTCAGLNPQLDTLGAVVHLKRNSGYSGNLCAPHGGSFEYVAFWADFDNNGTFDEYLGTASVKVHDIDPFPGGGIDYSVFLPVNFNRRLRSCRDPQVIGIRAVLSWATPPSTSDPNELKTWGNRIDVKVQLRPTAQPGTGGLIHQLYDVGNVPLAQISASSHLAFPGTGSGANRPWGGLVRIGGRIQGAGAPPSVWFKVEYSPIGAGDWHPVTNQATFEMMFPLDFLHPQHNVTVSAVGDGWLAYQENLAAFPAIFERTALLSWWNTNGLEDGTYDLRLTYTTDNPASGTPANVVHSAIVSVIVCNTGFIVSPTANAVLDPAATLDLIINGGDCHQYNKKLPDIIAGQLKVVHPYFGSWSLDLQPTTHTNGVNATPSSRSYITDPDTGDAAAGWTLSVGSLDPCGYTLMLHASDRTIINSNGAIMHTGSKAVGFSVI